MGYNVQNVIKLIKESIGGIVVVQGVVVPEMLHGVRGLLAIERGL